MTYRLEVKHRALPPSPYRWEIYAEGRDMWVEQSAETYRSERAAAEAGRVAMDRLIDRDARLRSRPPKRPRDPNQLAKAIVDIATSEDDEVTESPAVQRARKGGLEGGAARAKALSAEQRSEIASVAAQARWKKS